METLQYGTSLHDDRILSRSVLLDGVDVVKLEQLELNLLQKIGLIQTLCDFRALTAKEWEYSGFPKTYTNHKWCQKFYRGVLNADGSIISCPCSCHNKP